MPRPPKHPHALRSALKLLGWTQVELAKRVGCATVTLERFLNGQTLISAQLAEQIAKETGLDIEQLLLNTDPNQPRRADGTLLEEPPLPEDKKSAVVRARERRICQYLQEAVKASLQAEQEAVQAGVMQYSSFSFALGLGLGTLTDKFGLTKRTMELLGIPQSVNVFGGLSAWKKKQQRQKRGRNSKDKSPRKPAHPSP